MSRDVAEYQEGRVLKVLKGKISLRQKLRFGETGWWSPTFREGERRIIFLSRVTSKDPHYEVEWHATYTGGVDFFLDKDCLADLSEVLLKDFLNKLEEVRVSPPTIGFGVDIQDAKSSRLSLTIANETDPALWINLSRIALSLGIDGIRHSRRVDWAIPFESPWIRIEPGSTLSGSVGIEPQQLKGVGEFTVMMGHSVAFFPHRCWVGTKVVKIRTGQEEDIQEAVFRFQFDNNASGLQQNVKIYFLSLGEGHKDPSDEFTERFRESPIPVRKVSECTYGTSGVRDTKTGEVGLIFYVDTITWMSDTEVTVEGGYYEASESATGNTYRLVRNGSQWIATEATMDWIA